MSRSGYTDDVDDNLALGRWRAQVASAMRGKRGQAFLREALAALDAMPDKRLVAGRLVVTGWQPPWWGDEIIVGADELHDRKGLPCSMGSVCLLGAVGQARRIDMTHLDPDDADSVAHAFGIAHQMAREIVHMNDGGIWHETPEQRWKRMRMWVANLIHSETSLDK